MPLRRMVTVRVPATSANMGPGFDCLGMALNVWNDLTVRTDVTEFSMTIEGEGAADLPRHDDNLVMRGVKLAFKEAGVDKLPPLGLHLVNRIPIGAGLGSSSAAIVAGLLAGLALTDTRLPVEREEKALQLAATVEGHVDNLAPCIYGGMQIGVHTGERWYTTSVGVPQGLQCILFVPEVRQETEACRAILPGTIPRKDAVFNIGRAALLVNAFASGNLDDLPIATQDALHQPIRSGIMPALAPCIAAALGAGAKGAFLSGAGSSIMALTAGRKGDIYGQAGGERRDVEVARAMQRAAAGINMRGKLLMTTPSTVGAHVTVIDDDPALVLSGRALGVLPPDMSADDFHPSSSVGLSGNGSGSVAAAAAAPAAVPAPAPTAAADAPNGAGSGAPAPSSAALSVRYVSTRATPDGSGTPLATVGFADAVFAGLAPDGGLYVPTAIPKITKEELLFLWSSGASYADVAFAVLRKWVGDDEVPAADLRALVDAAYAPLQPDGTSSGASKGTWDTPAIAPLVPLTAPGGGADGTSGNSAPLYLLEQFHGPTCAFKDHALQLLGHLFSYLLARRAAGSGATMTILGATSGDTGSAAIAGLRGKPGVEVFILHPRGRVAAVQEMQMTSVLDGNVHNLAVSAGSGKPAATFDDCQAIVKQAFADPAFRGRHGLSAINSINWARVLAQSVYYVWAYVRYLDVALPWAEHQRTGLANVLRSAGAGSGSVSMRNAAAHIALPPVTFVVPTGNFGNALSGHYARSMGVPIGKLVVATNANDIMHRFIATGDYSAGPVAPTLAPSMDIQLASNLERYWWNVAGGDGAAVARWVAETTTGGRKLASFPPALQAALQADFGSSTADDGVINAVIDRYLTRDAASGAVTGGYALCPHTACGVHAAEQLQRRQQADSDAASAASPIIVLATAHPAKFAADTPALAGLYGEVFTGADEGRLAALASVPTPAGMSPPLPPQLRGLAAAPRSVTTVAPDAAAVKAVVDAVTGRRA